MDHGDANDLAFHRSNKDEEEAIQLYMQLAESVDDELAAEVLKDQ